MSAQTSSSSARPNSLARVAALNLPRLEGPVPVFYSVEAKPEALRYQKAIGDCVAWYTEQLHVSVPVTAAVLSKADWDKVGGLVGYPMPQAQLDANLVVLPITLKGYPGQEHVLDPDKKLQFISFHEIGHLFQRAVPLNAPDLFLQEFYATALASSYVLSKRSDIRETATNMYAQSTRPRYTSLEDLDLVYIGVGYSNYDWLQTQIARIAVYFVGGQDIGVLVTKLKADFPPDQRLSTGEVIDKLDAIRPGFRAYAGELGKPTSLLSLTPGPCPTSTTKRVETSIIGIRNLGDRPLTVTQDDGSYPVVDHGIRILRGQIGEQLHFRYELGFTPETLDGKRHKLQVTLVNPGNSELKNIRLRYRSGYVPLPTGTAERGSDH